MFVVGQDGGGDNFRVECGATDGAADPTLAFRITSGRVEQWK